MLQNIDRYIEYYKKINKKFIVFKKNLFVEYNKMIIEIGPIENVTLLNNEDKLNILKDLKFKNDFLLRTNEGLREEYCKNNWYAVICDSFKDINQMKSKNKSEVNRGLKNCSVKLIDADFLAEHGYDIYVSAFKNYKKVTMPNITKDQYYNDIIATKSFSDIIHHWGIFYNNKIIGYATNYLYDNIEVNYSVIKFDPHYLKYYPSYALIYTMNKYYLQELNFKYVNDGFRNLLHKTKIQDFLIKKFNFKKQYLYLDVIYKTPIKLVLNSTFFIRNILGKYNSKLNGLYKLEEIRRLN